MKIKVCGLNNQDDINKLNNIDIDFLGFIFYKKSPRFVDHKIKISKINKEKVGVFVNENLENILDKIKEYNLTFVQLHGDETPMFCKKIMDHCKVIKAFRISDDFNLEKTTNYIENCDYFLFDTFTKDYGGSGKRFNWEKIKSFNYKKFFLSGGINLNSINDIYTLKNENDFLFGIDINSKFEIKPGNKDLNKIKILVNNLRNGKF